MSSRRSALSVSERANEHPATIVKRTSCAQSPASRPSRACAPRCPRTSPIRGRAECCAERVSFAPSLVSAHSLLPVTKRVCAPADVLLKVGDIVACHALSPSAPTSGVPPIATLHGAATRIHRCRPAYALLHTVSTLLPYQWVSYVSGGNLGNVTRYGARYEVRPPRRGYERVGSGSERVDPRATPSPLEAV